MDEFAVYEEMSKRDLDCNGSWFDDEGNPQSCLDVDADTSECCSACLGWWAVCELYEVVKYVEAYLKHFEAYYSFSKSKKKTGIEETGS